jgi:hypothetical protein
MEETSLIKRAPELDNSLKDAMVERPTTNKVKSQCYTADNLWLGGGVHVRMHTHNQHEDGATGRSHTTQKDQECALRGARGALALASLSPKHHAATQGPEPCKQQGAESRES